MAQTMKDIKRRISGVGNIMQITNAMELASSAKLRKSRRRLETTRPYYHTVHNNINEILSLSRGHSSIFLEERPVKNRAVLLLSSHRGLAGGYNINVAKKALEYKSDPGVETVYYVTGNRAVDIMRRCGCNVNSDFTYIDEEPDLEDAMELGDFLLNKIESKEVDEVIVVYTRFDSVLTLVPTEMKLVPATDFEGKIEGAKPIDIEYEPSASVVLTQMIRQYVNVSIYGALLEASASEHASRRTAMENATDNGQELLEDLELVYNRARQANTTQEISEIVGGAEALK